jgi:hypothetical protein
LETRRQSTCHVAHAEDSADRVISALSSPLRANSRGMFRVGIWFGEIPQALGG